MIRVEVTGFDHFAVFEIALLDDAPFFDGFDAAAFDTEPCVKQDRPDDLFGRIRAEAVANCQIWNLVDRFLPLKFFACAGSDPKEDLACGDVGGDPHPFFDGVPDFFRIDPWVLFAKDADLLGSERDKHSHSPAP